MEISAEIVRERFDYDPMTGKLLWKKVYGQRRVGTEAGYIHDKHGYRSVRLYGKSYLVHRLIWLYVYGEWPNGDVDHVNRDPSDNRLCNLREATRSQNLANAIARKHNKSGFKGVCWDKKANMYRAEIGVMYKKKTLGWSPDPVECHKMYIDAAQRHFGEYARSE